jgi:ribosomal protein S21
MNSLTSNLRTLTLRSNTPLLPSSNIRSSSRYFSSSSSTSSDKLESLLKGIQASKPPPSNKNKKRQSIYPSESSSFLLNSSTPSSRTSTSSNGFRSTTPEEIWSHSAPIPYSPSVTTTSSRSFAVQSGNVARAYRNLNRVLNENNVRRELKRQERFEGGGDKRVRLNSERHRKRFKVAVGKAVSLAMRMKDL